MVNKLSGLRIVLTGAGGGIGRAARRHLLEEGAVVTGIDVWGDTPPTPRHVWGDTPPTPRHLHEADGILAADVTDADQVQSAMEEASRRMGGIDVLVNGAGIGDVQDGGDFPDRDARRIMEVNFWGSWQAAAAALPHLLASHGQLVNVVSGLADVAVPYAAAYTASKRAVEGWANVLRLEYRGRLDVTLVYPGYIRTAIHERPNARGVTLEGLARAETVEQAAAAIAAACRTRPRRLALTRRSALEYWLGRHAPALVSRIVASRVEQLSRGRPRPGFLRFPEAGPWSTRPS